MNNYQKNSMNRYKRRLKLKRIAISGLVVFTTLASSYGIVYAVGRNDGIDIGRERQFIPTILSDTALTRGIIHVSSAETLDEIVDKYYTKSYSDVYESKESYKKAIRKMNFIDDKVESISWMDLSIPLVVGFDNEIYAELVSVEQQIMDIEKNSFWVSHIVEPGENVSYFASSASGSYNETMTYIKLIEEKNSGKIKNISILATGDEIYIPNPKLGPLKMRYLELKEELPKSLEVTPKKSILN